MRTTVLATAAALLAAGALPAAANPIAAITPLWTFDHNVAPTIGRSSEIPFWDAATGTLWVVGGNGLDVLDLAGNRLQTWTSSAFGSVNSLAIAGSTLASFSVEAFSVDALRGLTHDRVIERAMAFRRLTDFPSIVL